jgi:cytochrome c oxidase cbb3-type subunit 4
VTLDINDARTVVTVLGFVCFIAITLWAFSGRARKGFDEAALLPFSEDDLPAPGWAANQEGNKNG